MQREEAKQQAMEAYKASKKCRQEKLAFAQPAFVEGMDDTWQRVLKRFLNLNLDFVDEDESDEGLPAEGALAPEEVRAD